MSERIIVTGATGFVGQRVCRALESESHRQVIGTSRDPAQAAQRHPDQQWALLDVEREDSIRALLRPGDRVVYLVHAMSGGKGYARREARAARAFGEAAREVGVSRIVYLGGPQPPGDASPHLASRLRTGRLLRESGVSTIELRAGMIMGGGSESWRITRDLSARLPVMLLPRWLRNRCEPVAIDDVVAALVAALDAPDSHAGAWDLPGPERFTYEEVLFRIASLRGTRPLGVRVPLLSPRLSSHWLRLVTRADMTVARELVEGLHSDLVSPDDGYFQQMPDHRRLSFDEAARQALAEEARSLPLSTLAIETVLRHLARRAEPGVVGS